MYTFSIICPVYNKLFLNIDQNEETFQSLNGEAMKKTPSSGISCKSLSFTMPTGNAI